MVDAESSRREYVKFFLLITGLAVMAYSVANFDGQVAMADFMRWFMGLFFLTFGAFKLVDYEMFVEMFRMYDIPAQRYAWYGWAYPFIEIGLGFLYISNTLSPLRELITIAVMGIGAYGIREYVRTHKEAIQCACLGNVIKLPLSTVSFIEDVSMAAMAALLLVI